MVTMLMARNANGVYYAVEKDGRVIWSKTVPFGHRIANHAGGRAFVEAAHEQEQIAHNEIIKGLKLTRSK